ncbi:MAG: protein kinase [Oscillospiraceae bacterium]|nr:protein kinase [Oscillospiraceae bacterium]
MANGKLNQGQLCQYELLESFQNQSAGSCRWTTGKKGGQTYFIKEFLEPVYPVKELSSPERTRRQKDYCKRFEKNKKRLYMTISAVSDGNLVRVEEFFRYGSKYYMAMPMVNGCQVDLQKLSFDERLLVCKTLAHSLLCLHREGIVHADIKASNVIMHRTRSNSVVAKLIDFDCSFFEDDPPTSEEDLGGDQVYLSPEANCFIMGEEARLTCKMDVFAMGLLIHEYLTGNLPWFDHDQYETASEAVLNGEELQVAPSLPHKYQTMIRQMVNCDPDKRWTMAQVFSLLADKQPEPTRAFDPARAFYSGGDLL